MSVGQAYEPCGAIRIDSADMPFSDQRLFDFNAALMEDYDDAKAHADLETYGDAFRFQLVAALDLDDWAERLEDPDSPLTRTLDELEIRGWVNATRQLAAYLRQGYYLPGGVQYERVLRDRGDP